MKYNTYYMDKYVNKSDKNIGLDNVANLNALHRNLNMNKLHSRQQEYNEVLDHFKKEMIYKINRFDPSNLKSNNEIHVNNLWFHYIFKNISNRDYAAILKICNINSAESD